jgi:hypothetical protein
MIRFNAHFDGKNICPDEPVTLPKGVMLEVVVSELSSVSGTDSSEGTAKVGNIFQQIEEKCGLFEGPEDLAAEHDHYLYGAPKRSHGNDS